MIAPAADGCKRLLDRGGSERHDEHGRIRRLAKVLDALLLPPKQCLDLLGARIPDVEPHDPWREALNEASFTKVGVLGNDGEPVRFCVVPDLRV